jgi:hypothetical protein
VSVQDTDGARHAIFEFVEGFCKPRRQHSSIGYLSLVDCERQHHAAAVTPDTRQPAIVLAAVKDKPSGRPQERPSLTARGRTKECLEREGNMPSDQVA